MENQGACVELRRKPLGFCPKSLFQNQFIGKQAVHSS